jgi:hypothetical protein
LQLLKEVVQGGKITALLTVETSAILREVLFPTQQLK